MSRIFAQRFLIVAAAILAGLLILEAARRFLAIDLALGLLIPVLLTCALVAAFLIGRLDTRPSKPEPPQPASVTERQHLEAGFLQLNQELFSRALEQTNELSRLNVELQFQMVMQKQAEESARANEERFRNMADNILQGLTIIENDHLVYVNERACEIFGECPDGKLRIRLLKFAALDEQDRLLEVLREAEHSGELPQKLDFWISRADGSRRCVRERYSSSASNGITRLFIVTSDITETVLAYQTLENAVSDRTRELSTVLDVSQRIASTLELKPLLHLILDQMQTIIPYSGAAIFTLEEGMLNAVAYEIPGLAGQAGAFSLDLEQAGLYRQAIVGEEPLIIEDIKGDTPLLRAILQTSDQTSVPTFEHARSWIGIPLVVRDHVTGLLSLTHSEPGYYTQRHTRLAITIANQVAVAIENARLYEEAQSLAVLEERHRIARELHDSVTQLLYGICLYCTATSRSMRSGNSTLIEQNLGEIKDNALQALQEMRLLILELNPPLIQKVGLVSALQTSLEVIETRTGLETELRTKNVDRLPRSIETELYRIAIEALNNLVRYARAKKVIVDLRAQDGRVCLEICDNGIGFDLSRAEAHSGMGLHNMEQRARQIGGKLEIISAPGSGTRILIDAPIEGISAGASLELNQSGGLHG